MASVTKESRLLAVALLNYADDEGYFMANEALIRGECFPFDGDSKSIRRGLQELSSIGWIALGTTSDGQKIGRVVTFLDHQRIDKASPSRIKEKTITWDDSTNPPRTLDESSPPEVEVGSGSRKGVRASRRAPKTPLPEGFGLSERVIEWARVNGFTRLSEHLDAFRLKAVANDYRYADWDAAFMNAVKSDWARVNERPRTADKFAGAI